MVQCRFYFPDRLLGGSSPGRLPPHFPLPPEPAAGPGSEGLHRDGDGSGDHLARDHLAELQDWLPGGGLAWTGPDQQEDLLLGNRKRMLNITG